MSADGRKPARRPFVRPIVRPSVRNDGTEACPSVDPVVVNEDERSLLEHEDDHSYTEFDLHDEMDWAEQIAHANASPQDSPVAHDMAVIHEDERSPLEDEEDHSFTEFDIDAEIQAKLGAVPVEPDAPGATSGAASGTSSGHAASASAPEAPRQDDPLPPHDPKAFYPEDERSPMDWEDDHSDMGHITEADLDRAAAQNAKPAAATQGGEHEQVFHDEDERSHLEHEDDHSYTDFDLHDEMDWAAQLAAQAKAQGEGQNGTGVPGGSGATDEAHPDDHLAGVDDDERADHHDHDDEADHSMTAFDVASEVRAKLGPDPEPAPPAAPSVPGEPGTEPRPISEQERAHAARNADGLDVHEDSVWEAEPEDSGDDCIPLAHKNAPANEQAGASGAETGPELDIAAADDLTGGIVLPVKKKGESDNPAGPDNKTGVKKPENPEQGGQGDTPPDGKGAEASGDKLADKTDGPDDTLSDGKGPDDEGPDDPDGPGGSGGPDAPDGPGGSGAAHSGGPDDVENPDNAEDDADSAQGEDKPMSLREHLSELRKRLSRAFLCVILGFFACMPFSKNIFTYLVDPLKRFMPSESHFIFTAPAEAFFVELKVAFVAGIFVTSPLIFYQLWAFIAPGLYKEEKLYLLPITFFSALFFVAGGAFCYLVVMPFAFEFFMSYNSELIKALPKLTETLSFVLQLLLAFGLVFELPLFVFFLARLGIITADMMRRFRRYAVLLGVIVAAILTPPDVMSQLLMAGPLLILYEISILIAAAFGRKKKSAPVANLESA